MAENSFHSLIGPITITEEDNAIVSLRWGWALDNEETGLLHIARNQVSEYFDGKRRTFDLPLTPAGTPFQRGVWSHMLTIPYGKTATYGGVADSLGSGPRAVGGACAKNPIPILIPCHRVIGGDGQLTGYSGAPGLSSKHYLLELEDARIH